VRECGEEGFADFPQGLSEDITKIQQPLCESGDWTDDQVDVLLARLDTANKPILMYCKKGARAAAVGAAFSSTRSRFNGGHWIGRTGLSVETNELLDKCCDFEDGQLRSFVEEYVRKKINLHNNRPGTLELLPGQMFITGQLSEAEYKEVKEKLKIKCVLNMRPLDEVGQFGLGVLGREETIIKELGMEYHYLPVPKNGPYSEELTKDVVDKIKTLPRPLLMHCRTGRRVQEVIKGKEL
jgi:protein tyrosine phosphatase (PTP) superfamily phosphohydrolase (DUF442 family)